jgi:hypothetical protein
MKRPLFALLTLIGGRRHLRSSQTLSGTFGNPFQSALQKGGCDTGVGVRIVVRPTVLLTDAVQVPAKCSLLDRCCAT